MANRDEVLEQGIADALITRMSNIRQINVRPIGAVSRYANVEYDPLAVGREQHVDAVLDGHIQKSVVESSTWMPCWMVTYRNRATK